MYPFYTPSTGAIEAERAADALERGILSTGEFVEEFEAAFADACGRNEAVAVASGSVALELAFAASELSPEDRILLSPFNCTAVLYALKRYGLQPVFVDIERSTFNIDTTVASRLLANNPEIEGILLTPTYGLPEETRKLESLAEKHSLTVINDFCQAIGARVKEQPVSAGGDIGICSFGATKPITTGEGGMVVTDNRALADSVRRARSNSGVDRDEPPTNVKMSDIEAAIGLAQLERYDQLVEQRRAAAAAYHETLPGAVTPQATPPDRTHVYHRFGIRAPARDKLQAYLDSSGVGTAAGITKPLYDFSCVEGSERTNCPETERLITEYLLLPMYPGLDPVDAERIADQVAEFYD